MNCNGININSNTSMMLDLASLTCEAKANSVFPSPFSYWSVFPPIWFDSWSGDLAGPGSVKDYNITFTPTHFISEYCLVSITCNLIQRNRDR
jgi:hypothetical protein